MRLVVRERLVAVGDDYWIEDEHGNKIYLVDGKAMRLRATFELKHGRTDKVLLVIRKKVVALRGTMTIEREGEALATVRRKSLSLLRNHYKVTMADGTEMDVSGRIADREFVVEHRGEVLAVISRRWLTVRDTYGIDIVREDADTALLAAVTICVVQLSEKEGAGGDE
ncbi:MULTISPECIES: LURP-one-related/scramblase family protein [Streptomyces]|uniref:LURP-one-related family protein n=1 Tax=Streptomyces chilikensis TaxID=1194079 RepID=A0ABV3EVW7_9ACTN|nr:MULTISPECIES: LURP-one-related family protein [Streptomyces]MDH6225961.1 uncharacterized protein YxjI [Streptomyces sp. MJP52]